MRGAWPGLPALAALLCIALALPRPGAALDWRMWQRHLASPDEPVAAVDWFTPTVDIGAGPGAPLPSAGGAPTLDSAALRAALDYAEAHDSYALIVAHRGIVQLEHYAPGFDAGRLLDSQSMHKPLAAILTMAAVADGWLALDDPLERFLPAWRDDPRGRITVRDVLYMQTGLAQPRYAESIRNDGYRMFVTSRLDDAVLALPAEEPPGTRFRSHYAATQLLQLVLEAATGMAYADYLRERLWTPLGAGYARVRLDRPAGNAQVFCCLQARPRDWLRVGLMLAAHGRAGATQVLPFAAFSELLTPSPLAANFAMQQIWRGSPWSPVRPMDSAQPERGLPMSAPFRAEDVFYLEGRGGQRVYVVPSLELVVVRQGRVRMDWDDAAFLNPLIAGVPARSGGRGPALAFSALLAPPALDYGEASAWLRRPEGTLAADGPAAFYIHPTTDFAGADWNAPHDAARLEAATRAVTAGQASVLDACCGVYAPRYRQAALAALGVSELPYELAFGDVRAAFAHFLAAIGDRPFVVVGHSQGALHAQHLLTRVIDPDPALAARLIAAYVIGIPVPEALYATELERVRPCVGPTQVGCVASWSTFSAAFAGLEARRAAVEARYAAPMAAAATRAIQCTNPLDWSAQTAAVPAGSHRGARLVDPASGELAAPVPRLVGARCTPAGALLIEPEPPEPFRALAIEPGNFHLADLALFHVDLAQNAAARAAAWRPRPAPGTAVR